MQKGVGAAAHRWHQRCGWLWAVPAALLLHLLVLGALGGPFPHNAGGLPQARSGQQPLALWARLQAAPPPVLTHDALAQPGASNLARPDAAMEQATGQAAEQATQAQQGPSGAVAQDPATPPVIGPSAEAAGAPRPVLASRAPPNFHQALQVRRGAQSGHGFWSWSMDAGRYRSELNAQLGEPQGARAPMSLNWSSRGGWDKHGVAPERFLTQPSRGGARAGRAFRPNCRCGWPARRATAATGGSRCSGNRPHSAGASRGAPIDATTSRSRPGWPAPADRRPAW